MIAVEKDEFAIVVADCNAHSVCIGVCADDYVAADFVGKFDSQAQRVRLFGIGHADGGKLRVGPRLLFDDVDGDAHSREDSRDGNVSAAVDGSVDDFDVFAELFNRFRRERKFAYRVEIGVVHAVADDGDMWMNFDVVKPFDIVRSEIDLRFFYAEIRGFVDKFDHFIRRFGRHLRSVLAVDFVSVVNFGIV